MNTFRQAFRKINDRILDPSFQARFRSNPQDFSRKRSLSFELTVFSILNLAKQSLQIHLNALSLRMSAKSVTKQAFSLSRQKVSWEAFWTLNEEIVHTFYTSLNVKLFRGKYLLLAIDGSTFNLPNFKELASFFGKQANQSSERVLGKMSVIYDVLNKITLDARITSYTSSEKEMALKHVDWLAEFQKKIGRKIILVFDRGYSASGFFLLLKKKGIDFVCRPHPKNQKNLIKRKNGKADQEVTIRIKDDKRTRIGSWLKLPLEKNVNEKCKLRISQSKDKIFLSTLFDKLKFKHKTLQGIYSRRWEIETNYRTIKADTLLENFSGKKLIAIFQEIYATIIVQNLARIFESDLSAEKSAEKRKKYYLNHRQVLGIVRIVLLETYEKGLTGLDRLQMLIKIDWGKIKKGRSYPRSPYGRRLTTRCGRLCYA